MRKNILRYFAVTFVLLAQSAGAAEWQTDYEQAFVTAKAQNKLVLLDFTGSDWCPPCITLQKNVFSKPEFEKYARDNLVLVEIDYPRRRRLPEAVRNQNERLKEQYSIVGKGFPMIVLVDANKKILGEFYGYNDETPADFIAQLEQFRKTKRRN